MNIITVDCIYTLCQQFTSIFFHFTGRSTQHRPGMSMGHTVAVKSKPGVKNALSMTIPLGTGIHRRMVYVEVEDGYNIDDIARAVKEDPYFASDETHVFAVPSVDDIKDMGHGVNMVRKGVSGTTQNQRFEFNMS